jgi:hypothetical protein
LAFEITTGSLPTNKEPKSLPAYIPFQMAQAFVRKINERRMKAEWAVTRLSVILGILPALAFLLSHIGGVLIPDGRLVIFSEVVADRVRDLEAF